MSNPTVDDAEVMRIWRECGLPEYFLGNGGSNHKLVAFAKAVVAKDEAARAMLGAQTIGDKNRDLWKRIDDLNKLSSAVLGALKWALPVAEARLEILRDERVRAGLGGMTGGLQQAEIDALEEARAAIAQAEAVGIKAEADMAKDNSAAAGAAPFAPVQAGPTAMVGPITREEYERRIARWYPHLVRR